MTEVEYVTKIRDASFRHIAALETNSCMSERRELDRLLSTISPFTLASLCNSWLATQPNSDHPSQTDAV